MREGNPTPVRVRFAPSPTGFLHVGGARTALFNWLFARHNGGVFVLRIEDTDRERNRWDAVEKILDSMAWLGMAWDEGPLVGGAHGPYFQSARRPRYQALAERLLGEGHAYRCYCTPEELRVEREEAQRAGRAFRYPGRCRNLTDAGRARLEAEGRRPAIRFVLPPGQTVVRDELHGDVTVDHGELDDFVIMKSDGFPAYNFAVVADDSGMRITHVIRGDDHLSNTPRQILLYRALAIEPPRFLHVPQILGPDKTRLSKRHGATSVSEYREQGYLPEAMMCYLARLGWSYDDKRELFTVEELVELFDVSRLGKTPSVFDVEKLNWVNSRFHRALPARERASFLLPWLSRAGLLPERPAEPDMVRLTSLVEAMGDRVRPGPDFVEQARPFLGDPPPYDEATWQKLFSPDGVPGRLSALADRLERLQRFRVEDVEGAVRGLAEELGITAREIIHPVRFAVTAQTVGPGLFDALVLVGRAEAVSRLRNVVAQLQHADRQRSPQSPPSS